MYFFDWMKKGILIAIIGFITVFITGNIINSLITDTITVRKSAYYIKDRYPIFISEDDYIQFIQNYPYEIGVTFTIHTLQENESFWDVKRKYAISLDTIIAANPHIKSLHPKINTRLVIPSQEGVLFAFDDYFDVEAIKEKIGVYSKLMGTYKPTFFRIISSDDIRLVFFKNAKPVITNDPIAKVYKYKNLFQAPLEGYYTSLFGIRKNPFHRHGTEFHSGLDIKGRYGAPIRPIREGIVTFTGWRTGYGKTVVIQHHDGYMSVYGHCSKLLIKKGQWATKQKKIALVGSTGRSTGPHLHLEIHRHGETINPLLLIW